MASQPKKSTAEKAFKVVDKQELVQRRREMMKYKPNETAEPVYPNTPIQPEKQLLKVNSNIKYPGSAKMSFLSNKSDGIHSKLEKKSSKEPNPELLERLANGGRSKVEYCCIKLSFFR